jgi:hypothetical protein
MAQGMAAAFNLGAGLALLYGQMPLAWVLQAMLVVAFSALSSTGGSAWARVPPPPRARRVRELDAALGPRLTRRAFGARRPHNEIVP